MSEFKKKFYNLFFWKIYQESLIEANYISININIQLYRYLYNEKI